MNVTTIELQPTKITHQIDLSDPVKIGEAARLRRKWENEGYEVFISDSPDNPLIRIMMGVIIPASPPRIITPTKE